MDALNDDALAPGKQEGPVVRWEPSYAWWRQTPLKVAQDFLLALAQTGNNRLSCELSGLGKAVLHDLRASENGQYKDPEFIAAYETALEEATDRLEQEARRRGVMGVERPVYQGGVRVGYVREYSDRLLETMLRARHPVYTEALSNRVNVDARSVNVGALPPTGEALKQWIAGLSRAAGDLSLPVGGEEP